MCLGWTLSHADEALNYITEGYNLQKCSSTVEEDMYDELWDNNMETAQETLQTPFLQHDFFASSLKI